MIAVLGTHDVETTKRVRGDGWKNLKAFLLYRRHLFAYESAMRAGGSGALWLDIGAGTGYALGRLADHGRAVVAIDMASTALRMLPDVSGLARLRADATRLPLATGTVERAVCFQVIEHVEKDVASRLLEEILRVLAPGGSAFVTTPNARWRLQPPTNPYHVFEYDPAEIVELCRDVGIDASGIRGVVGVDGAQEIELARLAKNPLAARGVGSRRAWVELLTRRRPRGFKEWKRRGARAVEDDDQARDWFTLTDDFAEGLDFWIEITK